jgi:hypothetical protein
MYGIAGQIHLTTADGTINAWCVDLPDSFVPTGGTYYVGSSSVLTATPGVPSGLTSDQIGEMGALAAHGDYLVDHPGSYSSAEVAAAIQIAMWDIEYGAAFTYDALGSPVDMSPPAPSGLVAQYIADVGPGNPWGLNSNFKVLYTDMTVNTQTLITIVPEPSTWAMMLVGFAGLGFAGYRVKAFATA